MRISESKHSGDQVSSDSGIASIFKPFRVLGRVCDHVSPAIQTRGSKNFYITTSIGHTFQIYDCETLQLLFVGPSYKNSDISSISCHRDWTVTGHVNGQLRVCERGKLVYPLKKTLDEAYLSANIPIVAMECLGSTVCTLQEDGTLSLYDLEKLAFIPQTKERKGIVMSWQEHGSDNVMAMIHPHTYLNKVLIGTKSGYLFLWNVMEQSLVYCFNNNKPIYSKDVSIMCISQAPVLDIVAIGLSNGLVLLYHLKQDALLYEITPIYPNVLSTKGSGSLAITSISFRTDQHPHIAIGNSQGDICIWDLAQNRPWVSENASSLCHTTSGMNGVVHAHYLHGQPILITVGQNNTMKEWIFEGNSSCRSLRFRDGHHLPPSYISFYGTLHGGGPELDALQSSNHFILSAGRDRALRQFSLFKDSQNLQLSTGGNDFPIVTDMSWCHSRRKDWDNLVTSHQGQPWALTWRLENKKVGSLKLFSRDGSTIQKVLISHCGNIVLLGSVSGIVDAFHIQSGIFQYSFKISEASDSPMAVVGLSMTIDNRYLIVAHSGGLIVIWDYVSRVSVVKWRPEKSCLITHCAFMPENNLFAVALSSTDILVYDIDHVLFSISNATLGVIEKESNQPQPVRLFPKTHSQIIHSICFRADGKWLLSCSALEKAICVWDMLSGHQRTRVVLDNIPLCMAISPNGDYLATCQMDSVGIHLWINSANYIPSQQLLSSNDDHSQNSWLPEPDTLTEPNTILFNVDTMNWQSLLHLDLIKERNKPKQPPKAPEKLPFFLTAALDSSRKSSDNYEVPFDNSEKSRIITTEQDLSALDFTSVFSSILHNAVQDNSFDNVHRYIKEMASTSHSTIDLEIKTCMDSVSTKKAFLAYCKHYLNLGRDLDLLFTLLNIFFKAHEETLSTATDLKTDLNNILEAMQQSWKHLEVSFRQALCFTQWIKGASQYRY
jgi:U3 small nucleolar RNA-associated protein 21